MYTGSDLQWRVTGLDARSDYTLRVAAVRIPPQSAGGDLIGPYSPPCVFTTLGGSGSGSGAGAGNKEHEVNEGGRVEKANVTKYWPSVSFFQYIYLSQWY